MGQGARRPFFGRPPGRLEFLGARREHAPPDKIEEPPPSAKMAMGMSVRPQLPIDLFPTIKSMEFLDAVILWENAVLQDNSATKESPHA